MTASADARACLIVNADDYGYFRCVSKGILEAATHGVVTATGVFANTIHFGEHAAWLRDCDALDAGVHLNLTDGTPLTSDLPKMLQRWSGRFPRTFAMAKAILSGAIKIDTVKREWRAQIERCLEHGLKLRFLNSHEHMHMLPALLPVAKALARDYDIRHIRFPTSRLSGISSAGSLFRSAVIKILETSIAVTWTLQRQIFSAWKQAASSTSQYLETTFTAASRRPRLQTMCHPGDFDPQEVGDPRLRRYHDWQGELRTLTSPALRELLARSGVRLVGYRHLEVRDDRLVVRLERPRAGNSQ